MSLLSRRNIHGDPNEMNSMPTYWNDSQMTPLSTPRPSPSPGPYEPSYSSQQNYSGNSKKNVDKGGMVAKAVLSIT
ncbi:hypothetical protein OUZ56_018356 [Daphnia magna]|uniref:Uncharacterized protein n=1 Tax=Daphnia magna TaxID=35525 RepID=A0ABQ9Z8L3_9CRUS|nr:hypothetical protein OUZ56_018356 [Daphnia magna]